VISNIVNETDFGENPESIFALGHDQGTIEMLQDLFCFTDGIFNNDLQSVFDGLTRKLFPFRYENTTYGRIKNNVPISLAYWKTRFPPTRE
jgi:hypothetical protein